MCHSCLESDSSPSHSLHTEATADNNTEIENMMTNDRGRNAYPSSKLSIWQIYSSLPSQHPLRFLGLCAQVFFYFLAYGYLQVSFIKVKIKTESNFIIYLGTPIYIRWF